MEKWIRCLAVMVAVGALTISVSASILGNNVTGANIDNNGLYGGIQWINATASESGTAYNLTWMLGDYWGGVYASGNITFGLYYQNGTFIANTTTRNCDVGGINVLVTLPFASGGVQIVSGQTYLLALWEQSYCEYYYTASGNNGGYNTTSWGGPWPNPLTSTFTSENVTAYLNYVPGLPSASVINTNPATSSLAVNNTIIQFNGTLTNTSDTKFDRIQLWVNGQMVVDQTASYSLTGALNTLPYTPPNVGTYNWTLWANLSNGTGYWSSSGNWSITVTQYGNAAFQSSPASGSTTLTENNSFVCNATSAQNQLGNISLAFYNGSGSRVYDMFANVTSYPKTSSVKTTGVAVSNTPGTTAWTSPTNAQGAADASYASCGRTSNGACRQLNSTAYGFALPNSATVIEGITLVVRKYASANSTTNNVTDLVVQLQKAGVAVGSNYAKASPLGGRWATGSGGTDYTYGSSTDLWGTTWTASEINDAGFGAIQSATIGRAAGTVTGYVDSFSLTVNYNYTLIQYNDTNAISGLSNSSSFNVTFHSQQTYSWSCGANNGAAISSPTNWTVIYSAAATQCSYVEAGDWVFSSAGECVVTDSYSKTSGDLRVTGGGTLVFDNSILRMPSGSRAVIYNGKVEQRNGGKICGSGCG
jgi:hypothetical protein